MREPDFNLLEPLTMDDTIVNAVRKLTPLVRNLGRGCDCDYDYRCSNCQRIIDAITLAERIEL